MVSETVLDSLRQAFAAGRPANGYIVLGPVRSEGTQLAEWLGRHLLGDLPTVAEHTHPDMPWFEPVKKSRVIDVETMKEKILPFLQQTSLSGGWKIAVIVSADRMNSAAANAFLKTLEEPAPKTVSLLLADSPDDFLPTVVSRCQVIQAGGDRRLPEPWRPPPGRPWAAPPSTIIPPPPKRRSPPESAPTTPSTPTRTSSRPWSPPAPRRSAPNSS